jgi:hypothetical protein
LATALATAQLDLDTITGASGVNLPTATQASIDAIELWAKRNSVILSGIVTGAGTVTEVFTISALGVTATVTADASGNRSEVVWS